MAGQINIGDTWKDIADLKLNIGDTWKDVDKAWINIGDTWKEWYTAVYLPDPMSYYHLESDGTDSAGSGYDLEK